MDRFWAWVAATAMRVSVAAQSKLPVVEDDQAKREDAMVLYLAMNLRARNR